MVPNLKSRLGDLDENNEYAIGVLKGSTQIYQRQQPIFDPLIEAHLGYRNNMLKILNLLKNFTDDFIF